MIQILLVIFVVAVLVFIWLKNKLYNRTAHRHNRMMDKQDALVQLLKEKKTDNEQHTHNARAADGVN